MGVLCTLNVAPTKLHPNFWASLEAFQLLAKMLHFNPLPHAYLRFYNSGLSSPVGWLPSISWLGVLFSLFPSSYKKI